MSADLEAVVRVFQEHAVRAFHSHRGPDGQWVDYFSCATCKRLDGEEDPELHPARKLAEAGLLAEGRTAAADEPASRWTGSSLI